MATEWKSQQGEGKFALQFETDDIQKYKLVEKAAQMTMDEKTEADVVEIETLRSWLYSIAINNVECDIQMTLSEACKDIISRLDGLRNFAKEGGNK